MAQKVAGISLEGLKDPVQEALVGYAERSNGEVAFDIDAALNIELTPEKPYSARSDSPFIHRGEQIGKISIIAFGPDDATGDGRTYALEQFKFAKYPRAPKFLPRRRAETHSEVHMTLASQVVGEDTDPVTYAGKLDVISIMGGQLIAKVGYVGQGTPGFTMSMYEGMPAVPHVTLMTGYRGQMDRLKKPTDKTAEPSDKPVKLGQRFGEPHAVHNAPLVIDVEPINKLQTLQVCGFVALTSELATNHLVAFQALGAVEL
jgi:hypothetical protein